MDDLRSSVESADGARPVGARGATGATLGQDVVLQCEVCCRRHDGGGHVLPPVLRIPTSMPCGRADCAMVADKLNRAESAAIEADKKKIWKPNHDRRRQALAERRNPAPGLRDGASRTGHGLKGGQSRQVTPASDDDFTAADATALKKCGVGSAGRPAADGARRQEAFVASGAGASAAAVLFEFFSRDENFMKPFQSTGLEEYTRKAGHGSSRMNNRAQELRRLFGPEFYLDNDPNGSGWGKGRGSFYRLCWTQDATSLSEAEKAERLAQRPAK